MRDADVAKVGKALSHPVKVGLIRSANVEGVVSPVTWSRENGQQLSNVAYHARTLLDSKVLELSAMQPMRGSIAHYYSLTEANGAAAVRAISALEGEAVSEPQ